MQSEHQLSETLARLGWSRTLAALAALARRQGQRDLGGTLHLLADVTADPYDAPPREESAR